MDFKIINHGRISYVNRIHSSAVVDPGVLESLSAMSSINIGARTTVAEGVRFHDPGLFGMFVMIGKDVVIESGVEIYPGVIIEAGAYIGSNVLLGPNVHVKKGAQISENQV